MPPPNKHRDTEIPVDGDHCRIDLGQEMHLTRIYAFLCRRAAAGTGAGSDPTASVTRLRCFARLKALKELSEGQGRGSAPPAQPTPPPAAAPSSIPADAAPQGPPPEQCKPSRRPCGCGRPRRPAAPRAPRPAAGGCRAAAGGTGGAWRLPPLPPPFRVPPPGHRLPARRPRGGELRLPRRRTSSTGRRQPRTTEEEPLY